MLGSLDHDADQRLGAGLANQDAARVAQSLAYGLDGVGVRMDSVFG